LVYLDVNVLEGDISSITSAPHGADGLVYPGTCRNEKIYFSKKPHQNINLLQSSIRMRPKLKKKSFNFKKIYTKRVNQLLHYQTLRKL
jgi:hypothetical protein